MPYIEKRYNPLRCLIWLPARLNSTSKLWPTLVFLHGSEEAAPHHLKTALTRHGPLNENAAAEARRRFIIVAPQLPKPGGDIWKKHAAVLKKIALSVATDYQGDISRFYLTGFSYGGNGVLDIAVLQSAFWAAYWPVDPSRKATAVIEEPLWISAGQYSRRHLKSYIDMLGVRKLNQEGSGKHIYEDAGLTHVPTAATAYANSAIYKWLLKQKQPS
jgi:predicted peptidase